MNATPTILSLEDSDLDFHSLCKALQGAGIAHTIRRCVDNKAALAALSSDAGFADVRNAAIIFLDLNLDGVDGRELLEAIRKSDRKTPIIILSTSSHPDDVEFCYSAGANSYLVKPLEFDRWLQMMRIVAQYWFATVRLPGSRGGV